MPARGFLGAGDLYIARYNTATALFDLPTGPYEATKFEITPKSTLKDLVSHGRTTYGQLIESVPVQDPTEFTIELPEVNKESILLALFGSPQVINQASGNAVAEVVANVVLDKWSALAFQNVAAAGLIVKDVTNATTYVLGVDYLINYAMGWIKPLSTGAIVAASTIHVTYAYNARAGQRTLGGVNSQMRAKFYLHGQNLADNLPVIVSVHEAVMSASSAFDFLASDFNKIQMKGRLKTPVGFTEPFTVDQLDTPDAL